MPPLYKPAYVRSTEHNLLRIYDTPPQDEALPARLQDALDRLRAHSMAQDASGDAKPESTEHGVPGNAGQGNGSSGDGLRQSDG